MKILSYVLFCIVGFGISYYIHYNGGDIAAFGVLIGYWTGYIGHMILNWK